MSHRAPPITKENAAEMGRRGQIALRKKREEQKAELERFLAESPAETDFRIMRGRVQKLMERIDRLLMTCKQCDIPKFIAAKERLWYMLFPPQRIAGKRQSSVPPAKFQVTDAAPGEA